MTLHRSPRHAVMLSDWNRWNTRVTAYTDAIPDDGPPRRAPAQLRCRSTGNAADGLRIRQSERHGMLRQQRLQFVAEQRANPLQCGFAVGFEPQHQDRGGVGGAYQPPAVDEVRT